MRSWSLALLSSTLLAVLPGCASRHDDAAPAKSSAAAQSNATVRKVTYFAAWVDERSDKPPAAVVAGEPAAVPARASADKRGTRSKTKAAVEPALAAKSSAAADRTPQPRYEYTVELDAGGYRTLVGDRNLNVHVNDRVLVKGDTLSALAN